ncbi:DMT family transporter [Pseudorhodoplanes sp.]|uniref:DMT family transporter n=1 Tax=Pseudorhodoplanes sp. TaxID=1934341 RepID=UPI003D0C9E37
MQNRVLRGVASLCLGVFVFSLQDPLVKSVSSAYPVSEVMAVRALASFPILVVLVHLDVGLGALLTKRYITLTIRGFTQFFSYALYYLAIAALTLADAVSLFFMAPLFIMGLASPYLGERISIGTLAGVLLGLVGVLIMLRPGAGLLDWAAFLSLGSALLYAFSQVIARHISETESATTMGFYQNVAFLAGSIVFAVAFRVAGFTHAEHPSLAFLVRPWVWPTSIDLLKMTGCGVVASAGMVLLSQAYRLAPANRVATFEYTGMIWTPLWGYVFFAELPRATTVAGALIIIVAGLFALHGSQHVEKRRHRAIVRANALESGCRCQLDPP